MAVASVASQMAITASPVPVAVVFAGLDSGCAASSIGTRGDLEISRFRTPASLSGVAIAALWACAGEKPRRRY